MGQPLRSVFIFRHADAMYQDDQKNPGMDRAKDLTPVGRERAVQLGKWIAQSAREVTFFASTYGRALETAQLAARQCLWADVRPEKRLREDVEGFPSLDLHFAKLLEALLPECLETCPSHALAFVTHDVVTYPVLRWLGQSGFGFSPGTGVELVLHGKDLFFVRGHGVSSSPDFTPLGLLEWLSAYE